MDRKIHGIEYLRNLLNYYSFPNLLKDLYEDISNAKTFVPELTSKLEIILEFLRFLASNDGEYLIPI